MNFDDLKDYFFEDPDLEVIVTITGVAGSFTGVESTPDKANVLYTDSGMVVNIDSAVKLQVSDFADVATIRGYNQKIITVTKKGKTETLRIADITVDSQKITWTAHLEAKFK